MKKDPVIGLLIGVLALSALASAILCLIWVKESRELRQLNAQVFMINQRRNAVSQLAAEAFEYSKRNPAITPILDAAGVKPRAAESSPAGR